MAAAWTSANICSIWAMARTLTPQTAAMHRVISITTNMAILYHHYRARTAVQLAWALTELTSTQRGKSSRARSSPLIMDWATGQLEAAILHQTPIRASHRFAYVAL